MYSFVPAVPADNDDLRFARPAIELPGLMNPASKQSTWGSKRPLPASEVRTAWEQVRHQVLAADLVLVVDLKIPPKRAGHNVVTAARPEC